MPVLIGGDNLPTPVGIGLTDLSNIGRASGPPGHPSSGITESCLRMSYLVSECPNTVLEHPNPHCLDLDLNGKRPGITSDGNFSSFLIDRS